MRDTIAPYLKDELAQLGRQTSDRLYLLFEKALLPYWTPLLMFSVFFLTSAFLAAVRGWNGESGAAIGFIGLFIALIRHENAKKHSHPFDKHLAWLSRLPFEVHGYLAELVKYQDHRVEYLRSPLALRATIRFTQPVAEEVLSSGAFGDLPGAEAYPSPSGRGTKGEGMSEGTAEGSAEILLYIQHNLRITGRYAGKQPETYPNIFRYMDAYIAWVCTYPNISDPFDRRHKLPLQKQLMNLAANKLHPLHERYPIQSVSLELVAEA